MSLEAVNPQRTTTPQPEIAGEKSQIEKGRKGAEQQKRDARSPLQASANPENPFGNANAEPVRRSAGFLAKVTGEVTTVTNHAANIIEVSAAAASREQASPPSVTACGFVEAAAHFHVTPTGSPTIFSSAEASKPDTQPARQRLSLRRESPTLTPKASAPIHPRSVEIRRLAEKLRIPHLLHFTRCENLPKILDQGLLSVADCNKRGQASVRNDLDRYDGQLDGISLSVAFPNYRMFYKYRQLAPKADWAILLLSPRILWQKDCAFYPHNAADARMIRRPRGDMKSVTALQNMFISGEEARESWMRNFDPTDVQAEVLVYEPIEPLLIEAIAFETAETRSRHMSYLRGTESFYAGPGKGLFGARRATRTA